MEAEADNVIFLGERIPIKTKPKQLSESKKRELSSVIEDIRKGAMNVERDALTSLMIEQQQYPEIDPSFLTIPNTVMYKGQKISLPKFGVFEANYHVDEENDMKNISGFCDFFVLFDAWKKADFFKDKRMGVTFFSEYEQNTYKLPRVLADELAQTTELPTTPGIEWNGRKNPYIFKKPPRELWKKYRKISPNSRRLSFKTRFSGVIPNETKQRMKEAEQIFPGTRSVYLITETKPEDWTATRLKVDPLLVGLHNDRVFLIDHFNTSPLEKYVREEFLE